MTRPTRRTLAGTLAPGDAYAPSLFPEEHPAPAAPLALFATDVGRIEAAPTTLAACPACGQPDHGPAGCPFGTAGALFGDLDHQDDDDDGAAPADGLADRWTPDALADQRYADLIRLTIEEHRSPFVRRKAAEAAAMIEAGAPEAAIARAVARWRWRHIAIITANR